MADAHYGVLHRVVFFSGNNYASHHGLFSGTGSLTMLNYMLRLQHGKCLTFVESSA